MMYRCVECGERMMKLFIQYSPGNIRLMKCGDCNAAADEYIECEFRIIVIDLILHKKKAYTHLLYNVIDSKAAVYEGLLWKAASGFLVLDAYRSLVLDRSEGEWGLSMTLASLLWSSLNVKGPSAGNIYFKLLQVLPACNDVISRSSTSRCIAACFFAHIVMLLVTKR